MSSKKQVRKEKSKKISKRYKDTPNSNNNTNISLDKPQFEKIKTTSIISFIFGLTFWIPLLNLFFGIVAIVIGIKALKEIKSDHSKYGGTGFAVAGIILGTLPLLFSLIGLIMCLYGSNDICTNMGLTFLVK